MEAQHSGMLGKGFFFCTGNTVLKFYSQNYPEWGSLWVSFDPPGEFSHCALTVANTVSLQVFSSLYEGESNENLTFLAIIL